MLLKVTFSCVLVLKDSRRAMDNHIIGDKWLARVLKVKSIVPVVNQVPPQKWKNDFDRF